MPGACREPGPPPRDGEREGRTLPSPAAGACQRRAPRSCHGSAATQHQHARRGQAPPGRGSAGQPAGSRDSPSVGRSVGRCDAPEGSVPAGSPRVRPGRGGLTAGEGRGAASRVGESRAGGGAGGQRGAAARRAGKWVRGSSAVGAVGERGCAEADGTGGGGLVSRRAFVGGKSRQSLFLGGSWDESCPPAPGALCPLSSPPLVKLL